MTNEITIQDHPLLDAFVFETVFPSDLETLGDPGLLDTWFQDEAQLPLHPSDEVKTAVRSLLRHGGFSPSGRSKPASEYLLKAREKGFMNPINAAVDACNVASYFSGLPISVVDAERTQGALTLQLCPENTEYVFNPSGQTIRLDGLLTLWDQEGPCGGPVKDSQRTKTHEGTTKTISIVWGTNALPGRTEKTARWYLDLLQGIGGQTRVLYSATS